MIRKTLISTGLLLVMYSAFILIYQTQIKRTAQTVEQRNVVTAEEFLYEDGEQADTIIAGSSMSKRLIVDSLSGKYYNLALEGMSPVDGLRLISRMKRAPRLLLVETNTLDKLPDEGFINKIEKPVLSWIRKYVPFTRVKYQPIGVLKSLVRDTYVPTPVAEPVDTVLITKLVQERLGILNDISPQADNALKNAIENAETYIRALRSKGTRIVFFEIPMDPRLQNTAYYCRIRELIKLRFPASDYEFVDFPVDSYQTTDGVHLPRQESLRYTKHLHKHLTDSLSHYSVHR